MRNAAANFDDDFDIREPSRKKAPRRNTPGGKKKKAARRFGFNFDVTRLARYAAVGMSATVALGIMVNALLLQKSRHPAPLFGTSIAIVEARKPPEPALPKAAPAVEAPAQVPIPVAKPRLAATPADDAGSTSSDEIARLLQTTPAPSVERPDSKTVFGAQRALVKLGFVLKPNGVLGPQTKKAIQLFEKDRNLPVSGELTHRVIKILAAESGLKIDH